MSVDSKESASGQESALSRWSRRKLEARQVESEAVSPAETGDTELTVAGETRPEEDQKPVLTDADMPDIDTLDESSDFSPFMSRGVSDELRNLALRKLFRAPVFNIRDGLDEYDDDFTSFEKLGDIVTSDMKHRIEMEQQKLREALAEQEQPDAETAEAHADAAQTDADDDGGAEQVALDSGQGASEPEEHARLESDSPQNEATETEPRDER